MRANINLLFKVFLRGDPTAFLKNEKLIKFKNRLELTYIKFLSGYIFFHFRIKFKSYKGYQ